MSGVTSSEDNVPRVIELLNRALNVEYSMIAYYPRIADSIDDAETKETILKLGMDSTRHADIVTNAVRELGGEPSWTLEPFPESESQTQLFRIQLDREKLASVIYEEVAGMAKSPVLRDKVNQLITEEKGHILLVEAILNRLGERGVP